MEKERERVTHTGKRRECMRHGSFLLSLLSVHHSAAASSFTISEILYSSISASASVSSPIQNIGLGLFDVGDEMLARAVDAEGPGEIHPGPSSAVHDFDTADEGGDALDPIAKALRKRATDADDDVGDTRAAGGGGARREKRGRLIQEVT